MSESEAAAPAVPGTVEVAARHAFDAAALERWLGASLPGFAGPLAIRQFSDGQSNPTFHLSTPGAAWVLRKKPPGQLLPSAHAIDREFKALSALSAPSESRVPVPRPRLYCEDATIIGTPFYLMDYVAGRIFIDPLLPAMKPEERRALYEAMVDALARLHAFDWRNSPLADYGKPEQYAARQIARWGKQYEASKTEQFAPMEELRAWLQSHIPDDEQAVVAHGDYRMGNLIFHPERAEVIAILDWELSTIGHPMSDLSYNCMGYHLPPGDATTIGMKGLDLAAMGIPTEREYLDAYAARTGRDPHAHWRFQVALSLFRMAAIQQGVYARSLLGNASSAWAHKFGTSWKLVAEAGRDAALE